ncbi:MAG: hypothetical protein QOI24_1308 [Acidobacteriota bacterium]|jgi:hypothetical protein|nr:hypothetical protein [Acidobacteriota bacterium]
MNRFLSRVGLALVIVVVFTTSGQSQWLNGTDANLGNVRSSGNASIGEWWPYGVPFLVAKAGASVGGTLYETAAFGPANGQQGIWIGYDTYNSDLVGIVGANNYNSSLALHTGTTNGTAERLRINSSGNVGIGTSSPADILHIQRDQNTLTTAYIRNNGATAAAGARYVAQTAEAGGAAMTLEALSSTYTAAGARQPAGGALIATGAGGLSIATSAASTVVRVFTGGVGAANERLRVDASGNVGIGTTVPSARLDVNGDINVTGNINAKYQDVAEWVPATRAMEPGTVVVLNIAQSNEVMPANKAYDLTVAGVVSTKPGLALGERGKNRVLIATTGRVRVMVDATNGAIAVGDLLVTSTGDGRAMRSEPVDLGGLKIHRPGTIIGKALEPLAKGTGEILVLLTLQ